MSDDQLFSLQDRVALVTGGSSGIGAHMARTLASHGAKVVVLARRADQLQDVCKTISDGGGNAAAVAADLMTVTDWATLADEAASHFGASDILVNAAGVNLREPADGVTQDGWHRTIHLNLSVPFFMAQAVVPGMRKAGHGNIINIASLQTYRAFENGIAYGASKGGIAQLTRAMAQAWSPHGITANAIAPGFFETELTKPVFDNKELAGKFAAETPIGRNGEMADLDGPLIFLASRASAYVTGQVLGVEGGYLAT